MQEDTQDLQDQGEPSESLKDENKRIAERIEAILAPVEPWDKDSRELLLARKSDSDYRVQLDQVGVRQFERNGMVLPMIPEILPDSFTLPIFELSTERRGSMDNREVHTTSYGVLDSYFFGADDKLYSTKNTYIFNKEGTALKAEAVTPFWSNFDSDKFFHDLGIDRNDVRKVDFIPEEQLRMVELQSGDYEKVEGVLNQIESGEFQVFNKTRPYG